MNTKLIQFTLLIPIQGRLREFNFRQRSAEHFDGNTTDERCERYYFKLVFERDCWRFADAQLPNWLRDSEAAVAKAIAERELT